MVGCEWSQQLLLPSCISMPPLRLTPARAPNSTNASFSTSSFLSRKLRRPPLTHDSNMSSNRASADDVEHVESTAVPGVPSTAEFPPSERPNACMCDFISSRVRSLIMIPKSQNL